MNWDKLKEPFEPQEIEWRFLQSGMKNGKPWARVAAYVTARGIQNCLDNVCGVAGWQTRMKPDSGGVICELGLWDEDSWVWRADGAPYSDIEGYKGAISGALKRAAVSFGIGRYLYGLPVCWAIFVDEHQGMYRGQVKGEKTKWFDWNPPSLPDWALPDPGKGPAFPATQSTAKPSEPIAEDKGKGEGKEEKPVEAPAKDDILQLSPDEDKGLTLDDILSILNACENQGDMVLFNTNYKRAVNALEPDEKEQVIKRGMEKRVEITEEKK